MDRTQPNTFFIFVKNCSLFLIATILLISSCKKGTDSKPNDDSLPSTNTRELLYISNSNIFSMDENGNNDIQLTFFNNVSINSLDYSRATDKVLFQMLQQDSSNFFELYSMNSNGSNIKKISGNNYRGYNPTFSSDGSKIFYTTFDDHGTYYSSNILRIDSDGTNLTNITNYPDSTNNQFQNISLSNDNSKIVFWGHFKGKSPGIYIMDSNGNNLTQITNGNLEEFYPKFSPDGSKILFTGFEYHNQPLPISNLYSMDTNGNQITNLTNFGRQFFVAVVNRPSWSKDGSKISFETDKDYPPNTFNRNELYVMNSDGSNQIRLTKDSISQYSPVWK